MEGPIGYPPPTLVRRRPGPARKRFFVLLFVVAGALAAYTVSFTPDQPPAPAPAPQPRAVVAPPPAPKPVEAPPAPAIAVEDLAAKAGAAEQPSVDGRQANRWHYVRRLGDGPGVIYSRTGGGWDFAFACTPATGMIEFISTGTGSPGDFDQQTMAVGNVRLPMDATYSKDGGGMISTKLPATHAFFNALDGSQPMEVQLLATRKTILPIGPEVVRLIRTCRGRG